MASHNVQLIPTSETDPKTAIDKLVAGEALRVFQG